MRIMSIAYFLYVCFCSLTVAQRREITDTGLDKKVGKQHYGWDGFTYLT